MGGFFLLLQTKSSESAIRNKYIVHLIFCQGSNIQRYQLSRSKIYQSVILLECIS